MFEKIKVLIEKYKLERLEEFNMEKAGVISELTRDWSAAEVHYRNCLLIGMTGWLGGDWTEYDFKKSDLRYNAKYFTEEEYTYYLEQIKSSQKILK